MVEVTESAKAAIDLLTKIEEYDHACDCDDCNSLRPHTLPFVVQAFATHRIEAAKAERDRIVAWLREAQVGRSSDNYPAYFARLIEESQP